MTYFKDLTYNKDIKAETLISQKEINEEDVIVRMGGVFSRNYSGDCINDAEEEGKTILALSRDGVFHLLPEGLFFEENRIKNVLKNDFTTEYKKFKKEKENIELFFQPFDTEHFKRSLELEKKLNEIVERGNGIFIDNFLEKPETDNKYIIRTAAILPFVSRLRGNFALLRDILQNVFSAEKVEINEIAPLFKRFIIHKKGLSKEEYLAMDDDLSPFFDFFGQWFLPVGMEYDYRIKDYTQPFTLGNTLLLDYNTHL
jgi:hypothetical protein